MKNEIKNKELKEIYEEIQEITDKYETKLIMGRSCIIVNDKLDRERLDELCTRRDCLKKKIKQGE